MKSCKISSDNADIDRLFRQYLEICNQAIDEHKDEFPYKEIISVSEAIIGNSPVDLAVYDDEPKGAYTLHFKDKKIGNGGRPADPKKAWRINLSYLKQVVENPDKYIKHSEMLDFDWLKSRLGIL